jgi:hypothetical protein
VDAPDAPAALFESNGKNVGNDVCGSKRATAGARRLQPSPEVGRMTPLGLFGILISLAGFRFARATESRARFVLFALLLLIHLGASVAGYLYAQQNASDAEIYYDDVLGIYGSGFGVSTVFIINLTQSVKSYFGGTMLDYFLLFQAAGFWGILFILRSFDDIHQELGQPTFKNIYFILFLPGLHFWTSGLGKDGLMFLAVALCVWAAFRLQSRYLAFAAGLAMALLVRPHIALLALIAFALTLLVGRGTSLLARFGLLAIILAGIGSAAGLVESVVYGLNFSSADSMTEFVETKSQVSEESGASLNITGAPFPVRLLSLLFQPFFLDANGAFGYVASAENLVLLTIFVILAWRFGTALAVARATMFARFACFFTLMIIVVLSLFHYNVGLGLRQKMMMMPALLIFFAAVIAVRTVRKGTVYDPVASPYAGRLEAQGYRRA